MLKLLSLKDRQRLKDTHYNSAITENFLTLFHNASQHFTN